MKRRMKIPGATAARRQEEELFLKIFLGCFAIAFGLWGVAELTRWLGWVQF